MGDEGTREVLEGQGRARTEGQGPLRVTVLVRAQCPTCDRMEETVRAVCREAAVGWERVDVDAPDTDPDLRGEYADVVPVTLVDGREHASWTVDADALRAALSAHPG